MRKRGIEEDEGEVRETGEGRGKRHKLKERGRGR
jgi:hypothetical protein